MFQPAPEQAIESLHYEFLLRTAQRASISGLGGTKRRPIVSSTLDGFRNNLAEIDTVIYFQFTAKRCVVHINPLIITYSIRESKRSQMHLIGVMIEYRFVAVARREVVRVVQ